MKSGVHALLGRKPRAGSPSCITIQSDDFTLEAHAAGPAVSFVPDRGPAGLRGAIRRTRYRRHHAPPADYALAVDLAAASLTQRVSRVRPARPRRTDLQLVWHRPVAAHAPGRHGGHVDLAL